MQTHQRARAFRALVVALACASVLGGCKRSSKEKEQAHLALGQQVVDARASDLRTTPDGKHALYLVDAEKPRMDGLPPMMVLGDLYAVPTDAGKARKIGSGVTNVPGGYNFTADSRWVMFLAGYNAANQSGVLRAVDLTKPSSEPIELGNAVSYYLTSPDSKIVAFVSEGVLHVGPLPNGPFKKLSGEVQTADFTPDGQNLLFKRRLSAAGALFVWPVSGDKAPIKLGEQVGDYKVSADSKHVAFTQRSRQVASTYDLFAASLPEWKTREVATGTGVFAFSNDSKWLGRSEGQRPELIGDLYVGPADGGKGRKIGTQVAEFEFAPASNAVAYLELYDISARAGVLGVASLPDGKPRRIGNRVPNFDWSPDGKSVAFVSRFLKPIYSIDLMLYPLGAEDAFKVKDGVFGYNYDPKSRYLVFRTNCLNEGRACDLMKVDLKDPKVAPVRLVEGVYTFKPSDDGDRLLVTYTRRDSKLYDAAVFNVDKGERKTVAQYIQLPALFTRGDSEQVVYIVGAAAAAPGVYVARQIP